MRHQQTKKDKKLISAMDIERLKTAMEEAGKTLYCGIADCHGIESFLPIGDDDNTKKMLVMRAKFNRQRHALYYEVFLNAEEAAEITKHLRSNNFDIALNVLKAHEVFVPKDMANSWKLIPCDELDPYFNNEVDED